MTRGTFTLKRQIGGRGAFAKITLETQPAAPPTSVNVSDTGNVARHYVSAAKTGINFAWTQLLLENQNPPHVIVTILEIVESPADTVEMMVVYAAAMAMCDALGMTLKRPIEFDATRRTISFPLGGVADDVFPTSAE
jgi:hypothetical protein